MKNGAVQNAVIETFEELNFYEKCLTALQMPLNRANTSKPEKYTFWFLKIWKILSDLNQSLNLIDIDPKW